MRSPAAWRSTSAWSEPAEEQLLLGAHRRRACRRCRPRSRWRRRRGRARSRGTSASRRPNRSRRRRCRRSPAGPRSWRVLVREDAEATVLGLDGVVADPEVRARRSACRRGRLALGTGRPLVVSVGVPAVRPDRVPPACTAGLLALTGVDGLEVVDVAVGLVEVACRRRGRSGPTRRTARGRRRSPRASSSCELRLRTTRRRCRR